MPHPGWEGYVAAEPVSWGHVWAARALDWVALAGVFLFWFGGGFLLDGYVDDRSVVLGVGILTAIFGPVVCFLVEIWLAVKLGSTVGLFLLGLRFDPFQRVDYFDDAFRWFADFWYDMVLSPLLWLLDRIFPNRDGQERGTGIVRDPRCFWFGARCVRALLAILILASPLPLVIAFVV